LELGFTNAMCFQAEITAIYGTPVFPNPFPLKKVPNPLAIYIYAIYMEHQFSGA
jgi:hypothetical protein